MKTLILVFIAVASFTTSAQADTFSLTGGKALSIFNALGGATTATNGRIDIDPGAPGNSLINQRKDLRCTWDSSSVYCQNSAASSERHPTELLNVLKSIGVAFIERDGFGNLNIDSISCAEQFVDDPQSPVFSCDIQQNEHGI